MALSRSLLAACLLSAVLLAACTATTNAGFTCSRSSDKDGYRCSRMELKNLLPSDITVHSASLHHGDWYQKPATIAANATGSWESNSDCPLPTCFYGTESTVELDVAGQTVTIQLVNNLDKLLYGCNDAGMSPVPDPVEFLITSESFSGCYCCHAGCNCNSFDNANEYEVFATVSPVAAVTSVSPASVPSVGGDVTVTGTGFADTGMLGCKFNDVLVTGTYVNPTTMICTAPAMLAPGTTQVDFSVSNLRTKWSNAVGFEYVATNPGAKFYLGTGMMNTLKQALLPVMQKAITGKELSTLSGKDTVLGITIEYTLSNMVLNSIDFGDAQIGTSPTNGLTLTTSGLSIVTSMDWKYVDVHTIIHGSGTSVDNLILTLDASFDIVRGAHGEPLLADTKCSADLTTLDISTKPKSAEILIALLKGPLRSGFQGAIQDTLHTVLSSTLNEFLSKVNLTFPIGKSMMLDFDFAFDPSFTWSGFELYMDAAITPADGAVVPFAAPALPQPEVSTTGMQATFSSYLPNTLLWTLFHNKVMNFVITSSMVPPTVPIRLNTFYFDDLVPALYKTFPNRTFDLVMNVTKAPRMTLGALPDSSGNGLNVMADLNVTFMIQCPASSPKSSLLRGIQACAPTPAFTLGVGASAYGSAFLAGGAFMNGTHAPAMNLTGHLDNLHFNLSIVSTNIGEFSLVSLDMLFNMMLRAVALDLINTKLQAGVLFPATMGGFMLTKPELQFGDQFITVLAQTALAPAAAAATAAADASAVPALHQYLAAALSSALGNN